MDARNLTTVVTGLLVALLPFLGLGQDLTPPGAPGLRTGRATEDESEGRGLPGDAASAHRELQFAFEVQSQRTVQGGKTRHLAD